MDPDAPYPLNGEHPEPDAVPLQDRIFAASREIEEAYERGEAWTRHQALYEAMALTVLTAVEDGCWALINQWDKGGRQGEYPSVLEAIDELRRIVTIEAKKEQQKADQPSQEREPLS